VVAAVLGNPELRALWEKELGEMRVRIKAMRQKLVDGLKAAGVQQDMSFITTQIGMFSYSGLSKDQMVRLRSEFGVYGTDTGRMCVAALNSKNIDYVCQAIAKVACACCTPTSRPTKARPHCTRNWHAPMC
jgi:aromatic-amino-acid transaminase